MEYGQDIKLVHPVFFFGLLGKTPSGFNSCPSVVKNERGSATYHFLQFVIGSWRKLRWQSASVLLFPKFYDGIRCFRQPAYHFATFEVPPWQNTLNQTVVDNQGFPESLLSRCVFALNNGQSAARGNDHEHNSKTNQTH